MTCPFLKEARMHTCSAAPRRKWIEETARTAGDVCLSEAHDKCPTFLEHGPECGPSERCPFLEETSVQYCSAARTATYVPHSPAQVTRCGTEAHRYCETYLTIAQPRVAGGERHLEGPVVDSIAVPTRLRFAANHMWLDLGEDGICHIGLDGFFARVLGTVDRIHFITTHGACRPSAVVSAQGVDWPMVFPLPVLLNRPNTYLRADPARTCRDPYAAGWLFEAWELPGKQGRDVDNSTVQGQRAAVWMTAEVQRLTEFVHGLAARRAGDMTLANDGGAVIAGIVRSLARDEALKLFHEFFGPQAGWMRS